MQLVREIDTRTFGQRCSDWITEFSGSWEFIWAFTALCVVWVVLNVTGVLHFDVYPFLFLNWILTIVSTFQNPLILMSNNRQTDRERQVADQTLQQLLDIRKIVEDLQQQLESEK